MYKVEARIYRVYNNKSTETSFTSQVSLGI